MRTLDLTRPYGEVFGAGTARYEQDHILFDAKGNALTDAPETPAPAKRGRKPTEAPAPDAVDAQLDAQLQG